MAGGARTHQEKPTLHTPAAAAKTPAAAPASSTTARRPSPPVAAEILAGAERTPRAHAKAPGRKPPAVHVTPPAHTPVTSRTPAKPAEHAQQPAAPKLTAVPKTALPAAAASKPGAHAAQPTQAQAPDAHAAQQSPAPVAGHVAPHARPGAKGAAPAAAAPSPAPEPAAAEAATPSASAAPAGKGEKPGKEAAAKGPAAKEAGGAEPEGDASAGGAAPVLALKMPDPPLGPSPATIKRIGGVKARAGGAAAAKAALPPGDTQAGAARQAVTQPDAEAKAHAQAELIAMLGTTPAPSPEIVKLCDHIYDIIHNKRPVDEDALMEAKPDAAAENAGNQLNSTVDGETKKVQASYGPINNAPAAAAPAPGQQLPGQPDAAPTAPLDAKAAKPDAVPAANVSLDADAESSKKKMQDAGMDTPSAQLVKSGPVAEARGAQGELDQAAKEDPAKVMAEQKDALAKAEGNMAALQQQALTALTTSRAATAKGANSQQEGMVVSEEAKRSKASADAQKIFSDTQKAVSTLLEPVAKDAMKSWDEAKKMLILKFKADLAPVEQRVKQRHEGASGFVVGLWDAVTGLPGWAEAAYKTAEENFGDGVIAKLKQISAEVNTVIATCELLIKTARDNIAKIFADLGGGLADWAAQEKAKFDGQLDKLHDQAISTRDNFNKDLLDDAKQAVNEVRTEIAELRKKAGGLLGRIANAIGRFLDDPVKFIIEGLLELVGIPPAAFWAVIAKIKKVAKEIADDPMKFANNLLKGLAEGFGKFFDNFGTHLLKGFFTWLFGDLKGVQVPKDVSLKSIVTFFLQIMGITWPNIRKILVKLVGAKNVALIEKVYSLVSLLMDKGPEGIYEMIKEKLDPQSIVDQIVDMAIDYMVSAIIKQVSVRIVMLFNPAGAIFQALEAIYRVLKWIFQNAARIFTLVETVVNGIADVLAGNTGGFASAVEKALGMLIAPVISFVADYLSLGDLPAIVAKKVESMRAWVLGMIEKALAWMIEKGKALLAAIGIGKKDDKKDKKKASDEGVGEELGFEAKGDSHRLWIKVHAGHAEVMVASKTQKLSDYLSEAEREAGSDPQAGPHIKAAREILGKLGPDADKLASKLASRAAAPDEAANASGDAEVTQGQDKVKSEEEQLVEHLKIIFELLNPIQKVIGENIDTLDHAPFGYVFETIKELREIRRAGGFGGADEKRFPAVHTTYEGNITLGKGPRRYDQKLIETFRAAVDLAKARLELDEAPEFGGNPETLVSRLESAVGSRAEGNRKQMERFVSIVVGGDVVTGAEVDIGARRSVDHTLLVREGDGYVEVAVEYKHWTGYLGQHRRKELTTRLRDQLHHQVVLVAKGPRTFKELRIEWPEFGTIDRLSQANFMLVFREVEGMGRQLGVTVRVMT